jgi:hypothetical protein
MSAGLHRKYQVTRTDGSSGEGGKHEHCAYFVLDLEHDEFAIPALKAYAKACRKTHPELADDLERIVATEPTRCACREAVCPHSMFRAFTPQTPSEMADSLMNDVTDRSKP